MRSRVFASGASSVLPVVLTGARLMGACLMGACLLAGCSGCEPEAPAAPAEVPTHEELAIDAQFCAGVDAIGALRPLLPAAPANTSELFAALASSGLDRPNMPASNGAGSVDPDRPLCGIALGDRWVFGAFSRPTESEIQVAGAEPDSSEASYLSNLLHSHIRRDAPLHIELRERFVAALRVRADQTLAALRRDALQAIDQERALHDEPPAFGEPAELVSVLVERAQRLLAFLPDVNALEANGRFEDGGMQLDVDVQVERESPLLRTLESLRAGEHRLGTLPIGTALAYRGLNESRRSVVEDLLRVAGARADNAEAAHLEAAGASMSAPFTIALGANESGFLSYRGTLDPAAAERAMEGPYAASLLSALFHCEESEAEPCRVDIDAQHIHLGSEVNSQVQESPDVERMLPDAPVLGALYVDARLLPAALRFSSAEDASNPAPIIASWAYATDLQLQLRAAPRSLEALALIVLSLAE